MYGETKRGHMIHVEPSLWKRVKAAAKAEKVSISAWVRAAMQVRLDGAN